MQIASTKIIKGAPELILEVPAEIGTDFLCQETTESEGFTCI